MSPRSWAFYGHSGSGTTTVVSHISAALAEAGRRVLQIGCNDPGATALLRGGGTACPLPQGGRRTLPLPVSGFKGVLCLEIGTADHAGDLQADLSQLVAERLIERCAPEFILYDLSGKLTREVPPLLERVPLEQVIAVATAEAASLYTCNELCRLLEELRLPAAVIGNRLCDPFFGTLLESFARRVGIDVAGLVPQALAVTRSAFFGETVIEAAPLAHQAYLFRAIARGLVAGTPPPGPPRPLPAETLRDWAADWGDRLYDLGEGLVSEGGAI